MDSMEDTFAPKFQRLREYCIKHARPPVINVQVQNEAMKGYPSKAKGSDNQSSDELRGYPDVCRESQ